MNKLRELDPELAYRDDYDLGNALDEAVHQTWDGHEVWYEDDFAYGICTNKVVEISEYMQSRRKLYAVVRDTPSDGEIVVTVIDDQTYGDSIVSGRWKERKPERTRYGHVGDPPEQVQPEEPRAPSLVHFPFKGLERSVQMEQAVVVVQPEPDEQILLTWTVESTRVLFTTQSQVMAVVQRLIEEEGVNPTSIQVWTKCEKQIRLKLVFE